MNCLEGVAFVGGCIAVGLMSVGYEQCVTVACHVHPTHGGVPYRYALAPRPTRR